MADKKQLESNCDISMWRTISTSLRVFYGRAQAGERKRFIFAAKNFRHSFDAIQRALLLTILIQVCTHIVG